MTFKMILATAIGSMVAITAAHANDTARFVLGNTSGQPIDIIQVSPTSSDNWGRDLLGDRVLRAGGAVEVTPGPAGCQFDVRVVFHNGDKEWFRNINLCQTQRINFANTRNYVRN